jgi:hypothetical protein
MSKHNQKSKDGVTVMTNYDGGKLKYGKVKAVDRKMTTYEKAMDAMKVPSKKVENTVKKQGKPVTKSNAKGTLGSKNSRKRN